MKIKFLSLLLLTLSLSLSACGVKVFKSSEQSKVDEVDITRPPEIVVSEDTEIFKRAADPDKAVSYEQWLKDNSAPVKESK